MSDRKVKIESMVKYPVVISLPDYRFSRTFNRELQSTLMDYEIVEEGLQRPGFRKIIMDGILKITDRQDRIDLGLESESTDDELDEIITLSTKEIVGYLKGEEKPLKDILKKVNNDLFTRFVNVAITSKISDYKVINAINTIAKERKLNVDMTKLFALAADAERPVDDSEDNE